MNVDPRSVKCSVPAVLPATNLTCVCADLVLLLLLLQQLQLTVFTAPLALYLRLHMPEPTEFLKDRQQMVAQRVASTAALHVARSFSRRQSSLTAGGGYARSASANNHNHNTTTSASSSRQLLGALSSSLRSSSSLILRQQQQQQQQHAHTDGKAAAEAGAEAGEAAGSLRQLSVRQLSVMLQRSVSITDDGRVVLDTHAHSPTHNDDHLHPPHHHQQQKQRAHKLVDGGDDVGAPAGCEEALQEEVRCVFVYCVTNAVA